ncbi:FKBP-type peptidyl-prolyl cis-trans isomerase [Demequina lignilytica]|uniref:Peptidyl-prolyl cis-trans isomerase n=1 Tax=Demequina lignilytica TaxID=3051663 RepID=A0AB35MKV9_9MICO|nr:MULTISPECIES: FKBP-type peptidyl-prolyl cis-trans isomerase [unclassified Demequina]MDN4484335.1 FKBP-type peptidyl-prolyl cis-trans isomerase [Demequina sp. SYSU T0a273]MDN4491243.1 FKBP-type peptidyl-prolyl cis-trans isomerase [Demequina sp. SYSU T00068]
MPRLAAIALALVLSLGLAACSAGSSPDASVTAAGSIDDIVIGGSDTLAPSLEFVPGQQYSKEQARVVWNGDGDFLEDGQPLLLDIYGASLDDGTPLINTYDGLPRSFLLAPEVVGDTLYDTLLDVRVGARVLVVAPPSFDSDTEPPIAMVVDVLPVRATGVDVEPVAGLPAVTLDPLTGEPSIDLGEEEDPPTDLVVSTLILGSGPQIQEGSYVTVNYTGWYWSDGSDDEGEWSRGDVLDSSWPVEMAPFELQIGKGQVIRGWDEGLLDQTAGSQVLLVVPATYGYIAKGTLVFVVDILDVWNPEV